MLAKIKILNPGIHSSIQDRGRYGGLDYGVSESGVMDVFAYDCANAIIGNPLGCPSLEILGGSFRALIMDPVLICVTGAVVEMKINSVRARLWESYFLNEGDYLELESCQSGIRNYLAINGQWCDPEKFLESYSTDEKANVGGFYGRSLRRGDVLSVEWTSRAIKRKLVTFEDSYFKQMKSSCKEVRVLLGPQEDAFSSKGLATFFSSKYEMTTMSNRMGLRFKGRPIEHVKSPDILSDAIPFGAIQIPGDGQPIIMMADRQTTGGYTKIATVVSTDLPVLAQTRPGEFIRFVKIEKADLQAIDLERFQREQYIASKKEETEILSSKQFKVIVKNQNFELMVEVVKSV